MGSTLVYSNKYKKASVLTSKSLIVIVLSVILLVSFLSPQLAFFGRGLRLSLPVFVLLFACAIIYKPKLFTKQLIKQSRPLLLGIFFVATGLARYLIDPKQELLQNHVLSAAICIGLWISVMIIKYVFPETLNSVCLFCLIIFGISLGLGIPLLISQPGIARLTMGNANESVYMAMYFPLGIANYGWYTPAAFAWPIMANWLYRSKQELVKKILGWGSLILLAIAILLSTFTMAMVLLLAGVVGWLFLVFLTGGNPKAQLIAMVIMVIFGLSFSTIYLFGEKFQPTAIVVDKSTRIISSLLEGKSIADSDPTIRTELFFETMKTFEKNPLFGSWGLSQDSFAGGHSSWADTLALEGVFGLFLWLGFLSPSWYRGKNPLSISNGNAGATLSWILWAIAGIVNPIYYGGLGFILLWLFDFKDVRNS